MNDSKKTQTRVSMVCGINQRVQPSIHNKPQHYAGLHTHSRHLDLTAFLRVSYVSRTSKTLEEVVLSQLPLPRLHLCPTQPHLLTGFTSAVPFAGKALTVHLPSADGSILQGLTHMNFSRIFFAIVLPHKFTHPFNQHLLSTCYVSDTGLGIQQ